MADAMKLRSDSPSVSYTKHFVRSKKRMPKDMKELFDWLIEYNENVNYLYDQAIKIHMDHLALCTPRVRLSDGGTQ